MKYYMDIKNSYGNWKKYEIILVTIWWIFMEQVRWPGIVRSIGVCEWGLCPGGAHGLMEMLKYT